MNVSHDMTEKKTKQPRYKKRIKKNNIVWNMFFRRLVLNVCNLSVAFNENSKLLNLVETTMVEAASEIIIIKDRAELILDCIIMLQ